MRNFFVAVRLHWKIEALVVTIILVDFLDVDTNLHSFLCSLVGMQCSTYPYDLPFWEVMVSIGTIMATYYAARNIRLVDEIEKTKFMPVLKIGEGILSSTGQYANIPITNLGKGAALESTLYLCLGEQKTTIDGMFDIGGSGDDRSFGVGDTTSGNLLKTLLDLDVANEYQNLSLLLDYVDIMGTPYRSVLPKGKLQVSSGRSSPKQLIVPRSGWKFLGKLSR